MKIFYAGGARYVDFNTKEMIGLGYDLMKNHLIAWIDKSELEIRDKYLDKNCFILIDSGAFSAYTTGKIIKIESYFEFIKEYSFEKNNKVNDVNFINLDVIGDSESSWNNQNKLESLGVNPIPVVHQWGFKQKYLERAFKEYKYFCFGGMWGRSRKKDTAPWLAYCFKQIMAWVNKGNKLPKIHLLGIGSDDLLYRFPSYSCDNTRWMSVNKYGESNFINLKAIPKAGAKHLKPYKYQDKYKYDTITDQKLLKKIMEYEIKSYKKKELDITNFWKKRGIDFEI